MKVKLVAAIITVLIIIVGFIMISPLILRPGNVEAKQKVMLSFSVLQSDDAVEWCKNLSSILNAYDMSATVFVVGRVAEQYPQTVLSFSDKVDVGSETYSYRDLTSISDYSIKLEEVQKGKAAVDNAGHLDSRIFRAPYGATDQDIYSLLSRSGILADFSYKNQYNVYQNGQFIRFDATVFEGRDHSPDFLLTVNRTLQPLIVDFDNTYSTSTIESFLSRLKTSDLEFVNASELVGLALTQRSLNMIHTELFQVNYTLEVEKADLQIHCVHLVRFMAEK